MELAAKNAPTLHHAGKAARIVRMGKGVGSGHIEACRIRMREIHVGALGKAAQKRRSGTLLGQMHLIPTNMGNFKTRGLKARTRPLNQSQTAYPTSAVSLKNHSGI